MPINHHHHHRRHNDKDATKKSAFSTQIIVPCEEESSTIACPYGCCATEDSLSGFGCLSHSPASLDSGGRGGVYCCTHAPTLPPPPPPPSSSSTLYNVLILGNDNISNGYIPTVKQQLEDIALVQHYNFDPFPNENDNVYTKSSSSCLHNVWLANDLIQWDVIVYNNLGDNHNDDSSSSFLDKDDNVGIRGKQLEDVVFSKLTLSTRGIKDDEESTTKKEENERRRGVRLIFWAKNGLEPIKNNGIPRRNEIVNDVIATLASQMNDDDDDDGYDDDGSFITTVDLHSTIANHCGVGFTDCDWCLNHPCSSSSSSSSSDNNEVLYNKKGYDNALLGKAVASVVKQALSTTTLSTTKNDATTQKQSLSTTAAAISSTTTPFFLEPASREPTSMPTLKTFSPSSSPSLTSTLVPTASTASKSFVGKIIILALFFSFMFGIICYAFRVPIYACCRRTYRRCCKFKKGLVSRLFCRRRRARDGDDFSTDDPLLNQTFFEDDVTISTFM